MPCYAEVTVQVDLVAKDKAAFEKALFSIGSRLVGQVFKKDGIRFTIGADGKISTEVEPSRAERAKSILDQLRRAYVTESLKNWSKANRFNVKESGKTLRLRRWV